MKRPSLLKSLSPRMISKAMASFDRATTVVVGSCWAAALIMMIFAVYTISMAASARREADKAMIAEPSLPIIKRDQIDPRTALTLTDRMKRRHPSILFTPSNNALKISTVDGAQFRQWLMALSYIEAISPDYQWTLNEFCVGKCRGPLMGASLQGEKISFIVDSGK